MKDRAKTDDALLGATCSRFLRCGELCNQMRQLHQHGRTEEMRQLGVELAENLHVIQVCFAQMQHHFAAADPVRILQPHNPEVIH